MRAIWISDGITQIKMGQSDSDMIQLCSSCRAGDFVWKACGGVLDITLAKSGTRPDRNKLQLAGTLKQERPDDPVRTQRSRLIWQQVDQSHRTCEAFSTDGDAGNDLLLPLGLRMTGPIDHAISPDPAAL